MLDLKTVFEAHDDEFLRFERIEQKLNQRPDVHAFILLDQIVEPKKNRLGGVNDMVCTAEHDEIWLSVNTDDLAKLATEDQIIDLIRCGIRYDDDIEMLCMYV